MTMASEGEKRRSEKTQDSNRFSQPHYPARGHTTSQPYYDQPLYQPPGPYTRAFHEKIYIKIFIFGIIFFMVGYLVAAVTGYMDAPDRDDFDDDEEYKDELDWYNLIRRSLTTTGFILEQIGLIIIVVALFLAAIVDEQLPPLARLGIFIAIGLIIGFKM